MSPLIIAAMLLLLPVFVECADTCKDDSESDCKLLRLFHEFCRGELSELKCALQIQEEIQKWLHKQSTIEVLITGKMGAGKTTLVKGLKEHFVPEEDHLEAHTVRVTQYQHIHNQVNFIFFDTPGLNGSSEHSYLEDMVENGKQPDMIIFVLKMDDDTLRQDDLDAMKSVTRAFGWKVWKNAMVVLTFANKVSKPGHSTKSRENRVYFNEVKDAFALKVTKMLLELNVQEDVANHVPVIPLGLVSQLFIESDGREIAWLEEFWSTLFEVLEAPARKDPPNQTDSSNQMDDESQQNGQEEKENVSEDSITPDNLKDAGEVLPQEAKLSWWKYLMVLILDLALCSACCVPVVCPLYKYLMHAHQTWY